MISAPGLLPSYHPFELYALDTMIDVLPDVRFVSPMRPAPQRRVSSPLGRSAWVLNWFTDLTSSDRQ